MIKLRCVVSDEITEVTVDGVTLYSCQGFIQAHLLVIFAWWIKPCLYVYNALQLYPKLAFS